MDFYEAFKYLNKHPIFLGKFAEELYTEVVKIDPETLCIEKDPERNTLVQVWLECSIVSDKPVDEYGTKYLWDYRLDCGGNTFEEAIISLAESVKKYYPNEVVYSEQSSFLKFQDEEGDGNNENS